MQKILLFGEAEKGRFCTPQVITQLPHLFETFGNPPKDSWGLLYGIQALLYGRELTYFRVEQEGFSVGDYQRGARLLGSEIHPTAVCLPGVGDKQIIDAFIPQCQKLKSFLLITEGDLFDYLTSK